LQLAKILTRAGKNLELSKNRGRSLMMDGVAISLQGQSDSACGSRLHFWVQTKATDNTFSHSIYDIGKSIVPNS
jgi:hypothetical protein